jgi:hypothetical protein
VSPETLDSWHRALQALATAKRDLRPDPDAAASRAYYAAFHAVSALFALEGKSFARHSAVEVAVHRDLVKTGRWRADLGADYSLLLQSRMTGDYGGAQHVTPEEAEDAVRKAERIVKAVREASGGTLPPFPKDSSAE